MINPKHIRELVIRPVLKDVGLWSQAAENLLMGTAAQESRMGQYLKQIKGPALGIFQMEPLTHDDLWATFLTYHMGLKKKGHALLPGKPHSEILIYNLRYAAFMARIKYYRDKNPLPHAEDVEGLAAYWKRVYNTHLGRGTVEEFIDNYELTLLE